jgi:Cu-Zn family superoxide dismutase
MKGDPMKLTALVVTLLAGSLHAAPPMRAVAVLSPLGGSGVSGTVTFVKTEAGLRISVHVQGLKPGVHGFHIHEFGDCSAADGSSAGGHFNPSGSPHGGPQAADRHTGDLGNITAGSDGVARLDHTDPRADLEGPHGVLGRGVIVHVSADDFTTQPTGNAGGRLACGVIGVARGE